jgi:hypothetical protein
MAERSAERLRLAARAEAAKHLVSVGVLLSLPQECSVPAMQKSRLPVATVAAGELWGRPSCPDLRLPPCAIPGS